MKITFLMPADDLTGGNRVVATYARILAARGHDVLVVSNAHDPLPVRERWRAWRRPRVEDPAPLPGHIALSGVPHRVLERKRPIEARDVPDGDVVIATWWETAEWMHRLPAAKGRRVHLIQGFEDWFGEAVTARVRAALRLPNRKIAISAALARQVEAEAGIAGVTVIANAVDRRQFDAPPRSRNTPPVVGYIHSQAPIKGADVAAEAVRIARRTLPDLRVLAFGGDVPGGATALPEGARFLHRPAQDALASLYAACDAWLFASRRDSFGLPILEAMACGTPVIGVPVGAAPDLLPDGGGTLVTPESPAAMAAAIVALCGGPEADWRRASARAHARAHRWSWEDATDRLLEVLGGDAAPVATPIAEAA
ncbi:MAG: glycosyltransferase family 4 protein [Burkholderiales bacterium]